MKHPIKHRWTNEVLFMADIPDDTPSGLATRCALEQATKARANLARAYLADANLEGAYLEGANLARANLDGANLADAYLAGANLAGAYLDGANLADANLEGERPIFQIGPIGSRSAYLVAYASDQGVVLKTGCFTGSVAEFEDNLQAKHGNNQHAQEYRAALALIDIHTRLWSKPAVAVKEAA